MTVTINSLRKTAELAYDQELVRGDRIKVSTAPVNEAGEQGDLEHVRESENDGLVNVTYPQEFQGSTFVLIEGSEGGEDSGTIEIA